MSVMSDQKKIIISEKERKQIYRAKLREELGDKEYKKQQAQKKREYRAKIKLNKSPQEQQKQIINNVVQKVVENVAPEVVKQVTTEAKGKITNFFKPITKEQYLKNIKNEPVKDLIKDINKTMKQNNSKPKNIINDNIEEEIKKIVNKNKVSSIQPLHVKYEGKKAEAKTNAQYLAKLKTVYTLLFNSPIDESIINELEKLLNGKTYNQGIINYLQFFKNINRVIDVITKKYTNRNTLSSYINAITSILSRMREFFPKEYDKIAILNIDLSKKYQRDRDTNDAPDNVINNLISFEPSYINKLLDGIKNINDKAL